MKFITKSHEGFCVVRLGCKKATKHEKKSSLLKIKKMIIKRGLSATFLFVTVLICSAQQTTKMNNRKGNNPRANEVSGEYYDWTKTMQPEQPWVRDYNKTLFFKIFMCTRNDDGTVKNVFLKFDDALEVLRKIDNLTLGIPKIVYLIGWQFTGHDSGYPSWDVVNKSLKRDCDTTALQSLKWLIREAKACNTTVSLHINMIDAYENSPLWAEYLKHDIIAKDKKGELIQGGVYDGIKAYSVSYAQEWKLGYAQKRIDKLIKMLPELKEGGTIHIDAFNSAQVARPNEPISPYLGISYDEEISTQRKIFRYWRKQGIDVTCELGMYWLRKDPFIGLQAATWWYNELNYFNEDWINKPKDFRSLPIQLSAHSVMHCEDEVMKDPQNLPGLLEQVCLNLVPWYYKRNGDVAQKGDVIITDDEVICPILWKDRAMVAYNKQADISGKSVTIPSIWGDVKEVQLYDLTVEGLKPRSVLPVTDGTILLSIIKNQPTVIMPVGMK